MKLGGFNLGKSKEKVKPAEEIAEEAVDQLIQNAVRDSAPVRPHAPLQELPLETEENDEGTEPFLEVDTGAAAAEESEPVKLVEVKVNPEPAPIPAAPAPVIPALKKDPASYVGEPLDLNTSIGNIFNNLDDEENPLKNLIKALPEVAASELIDDLKEINEIIKDWQKK